MNGNVRLPVIPETITVHLGEPSSPAPNVTLSFADYVKNVASSEIYPTWPESAIRANILAQISFALNRVYSEYYRSRGYDFDITNSTAYDQSFVEGRDIFENISQIVDEIFNNYIVREGGVEPLFAAYCDGDRVVCRGLSQWGSVALANQGLTPYEILTNYYGDNIGIVEDAPVAGIGESYPGRVLKFGSAGDDVRTLQVRLNRISRNYPSIPKIPRADGIFGTETERAVKAYQRAFNLTDDGLVGRATWYSIARTYNAVKRISDLYSEGIPREDVTNIFDTSLSLGDTGINVRELQYYLAFIGYFNDNIPPLTIDGIFGPSTENAVKAFQTAYGFEPTGEATPALWDAIYSAYVGILNTIDESMLPRNIALYPGVPLRVGSEGDAVRSLQEYLNYIAGTYTEIPRITADGVFGTATENAVKAYQELFGLPVSGVVGSVTWNSIIDNYLSLFEGNT